ncbi:tripartite tricarboxylate transporter permease [Pseudochelatococcus sp. B33]
MDIDTLINNISYGLNSALSMSNLFYCFIGVFLGMLIGVLPGIGPLATISMLLPLTFYLDPTSALIMLAGIYYGGAYGGSTTAILLNVPGSASSTVACLDGYPMARQGRAGIALFTTTIASFFGASVGIILMMLFSPAIVRTALAFGSAEYFALMVLGLVAASTMSSGSAIRSIAMVVLGIGLGCVGVDVYSGVQRFDFGFVELYNGLDLVAVAMGLFGLTEIITSVRDVPPGTVGKVTFRSMLPMRDDIRRSCLPAVRGTAIGSALGALPGAGSMLASFLAYGVEKKVAKDPSRFGKGAIEGVVAPEAANNASDQTAFIPMMTLGIPSSPIMALMLGMLMMHGVAPGPRLMLDKPDMFWGLVMSFWIGNLMLLILNLPLIGLWVRLLSIPYRILYPAIVVFACIGVYSVNFSTGDVMVMIAFGILGYILRLFEFPVAPLMLGFILGPLMEEHFRRALLLSQGNLSTFIERPISLGVLAVTAALLAYSIFASVRTSLLRSETASRRTLDSMADQ